MAQSRFLRFPRAERARLGADAPLTLGEDDLTHLRGLNEPNLFENILPTRDRAHLILEKGPDHSVRHVQLRKA
jgi:hypothetical protein